MHEKTSSDSTRRRPQRALSMAAETRKPKDQFYFSSEIPFNYPLPTSPISSNNTQPQPTHSNILPDPNSYDLQMFQQFQRINPLTPENAKEAAKSQQRQRREQIVLMLQQQHVEAQEKAKQAKLEKQQMKIERKQKKAEEKHHSQLLQREKSNRSSPFSTEPITPPSQHLNYFESTNKYPSSSSSSTTSSTSSMASGDKSDRIRPLSLKNNTKSMYDLRPWSGAPQSPPFENKSGYDSDENGSVGRSHGWDSLMETLYSPTTTSPSDTISWDSKEDCEFDVMDSMNGLSLSHECNGSGNGKYLLVMGANGRTGVELVRQGLARNYRVTAFVRDDKQLLEDSSLRKNQNLIIVRGSPTSQDDVDRCVEGQDVVVNVIGARLLASDTTIGSHSQVILNNALKKYGVRRMIVVTSYGCVGLRHYLIATKRLFSKLFMTNILKDKVLQEDIIQRESDSFDWTIVRPITLKDGELTGRYWLCSDELPKSSKIKVLARQDLVHYILSIIPKSSEYGKIRSIAGRAKSSKPTLGRQG